MTWVCLAHGLKGAGGEMDGGWSKQFSFDVTNTFDDLLMIWSDWKQVICHWLSQHLVTRCCNCYPEWAQRRILLWRSEVSWPLHSPDCNLCVFLLWEWVKLQVWRVKPLSLDDFKTAVEDINAAILDKYICATAAPIMKQCQAFLLADGGNCQLFLRSMWTWN